MGQVRTGLNRSNELRSDQVRIGQDKLGQAKTVMIGLDRSQKDRTGKVRQIRTGQEALH